MTAPSEEVTAVDATRLTVKAKAGDKSFRRGATEPLSPPRIPPWPFGDHVTVTTAKDSDTAAKITIRKAGRPTAAAAWSERS